MPALVTRRMFDYIAHVSREDGSVVELSGTKEQEHPSEVYKWLVVRAAELGGYLASQAISESHDYETRSDMVDEKIATIPSVAVPDRPAVPAVPSVFGDSTVFGEYKDTYSGSSLVTYKVTEE